MPLEAWNHHSQMCEPATTRPATLISSLCVVTALVGDWLLGGGERRVRVPLLALAIATKARLAGMHGVWIATTWAEECTDKVPSASS